MTSNSSSIVISFSIAILLLLTLLLLISYNSKCKMDNVERFEDDAFQSTNMYSLAQQQHANLPSVGENANKLANVENASNPTLLNGVNASTPNDPQYGSAVVNNNLEYFTDSTQLPPQKTDDLSYLNRDRLTSSDLLPKDAGNSKWAEINPSGTGDIRDQNFLTAGYHIGINTIGQSLRNANLQLRSEPPNPQIAVSPWGISTIEPDVRPTSFEIGSTPTNN